MHSNAELSLDFGIENWNDPPKTGAVDRPQTRDLTGVPDGSGEEGAEGLQTWAEPIENSRG